MNKNFVVALFALVSTSAFALDQAPAPIMEGGPVALDQVQLVEHFTPAQNGMVAQHSVDVVVSGGFQSMCSGLTGLVKQVRTDARTNSYQFQVTGVYAPIRCMAIGRVIRKTFVLETLFLQANDQVPAVTVNNIRGVRVSGR